MNKKPLFTIFTGIFFSICFLLFYVVHSFKSSLNADTPCAFCDSQVINRQKFYEDDLVFALYTHKPIVSSHFLIIPKRHIERLEMLSAQETLRIKEVIAKVSQASEQVFQTSSYLIHQKNGQEVGQTVPHVHFHLIAKSKGDDSSLKFFINMILAHLKGPISLEKLQYVIQKMDQAISLLKRAEQEKS